MDYQTQCGLTDIAIELCKANIVSLYNDACHEMNSCCIIKYSQLEIILNSCHSH